MMTNPRNEVTDKAIRYFARKIASMDKRGELEDPDTFSPTEFKDYIYRNNRVLDITDFSEASMKSFSPTRKYWDNVYKKYLINRYIAPRYKHSMKSWISPKSPHMKVDADLAEGTFMLDLGARKMKVKVDGKETTLGKAWDKHIKDKKNAEDFEFVIVRVPMDSVSGARVRKFAGFTKNKGFSITTNGKDNLYLGGADKDSDSVFIYQGFGKEIKKA